MTIVIESEVIAPLLLRLMASSLNQGPLALITGVTVTPPVPPPFTVRVIGVVRVRPPPVPVMVTVVAPRVAALDAARVSVLLPPVVDGGLKLAVTPLGNPLALKATLFVKPPVRVMVIALVTLSPRLIARLEGFAESVKSGGIGRASCREMGMVRVGPPPIPVMVTAAGPVTAVLDAVKVRAVLFPVVDGGLKLAVTPVGNPLALKATLSVKPPARVIVIVLIPLSPRLIVRLDGFAESVKSG